MFNKSITEYYKSMKTNIDLYLYLYGKTDDTVQKKKKKKLVKIYYICLRFLSLVIFSDLDFVLTTLL